MMERIDVETFYTGFLLALAAAGCEEFVADGLRFHDAFYAAQAVATESLPVEEIGGVEELLAFGMSARLLWLLAPDLVIARFRDTPDRARRELERLTPHYAVFDRVAVEFLSRVAVRKMRENVPRSAPEGGG